MKPARPDRLPVADPAVTLGLMYRPPRPGRQNRRSSRREARSDRRPDVSSGSSPGRFQSTRAHQFSRPAVALRQKPVEESAIGDRHGPPGAVSGDLFVAERPAGRPSRRAARQSPTPAPPPRSSRTSFSIHYSRENRTAGGDRDSPRWVPTLEIVGNHRVVFRKPVGDHVSRIFSHSKSIGVPGQRGCRLETKILTPQKIEEVPRRGRSD